MIYCFNFNFLRNIESADLLTYLALFLAFLAYCRSVDRDLESWRSLFMSFKNDLINQKNWLASEYFAETYKEKHSFSPNKIIYPLSFESLPEIIRRGVSEFSWIKNEFAEYLSMFNERIVAFNSALDHVKKIVSSDPASSERLLIILDEIGLNNESVEFYDFKNKINELKKENDTLLLADNIRRLHKVIHVKIIGNRNNGDSLSYLYHEIIKELENILSNYDRRKPLIVRYQNIISIGSLFLFFVIEIFLK